MKRTMIYLALMSCIAFAVEAAQAAPVAMVAQVQGGAQVRMAGRWRPARMMLKLSSGDQVKTGSGQSVALVMLGSAARFQVGPGRVATVGASSIAGATSLGGMRGPSAKVAQRLGGARTGAFFARGPIPPTRMVPASSQGVRGTHWVRADAPVFAWTPVMGALSYQFTLMDGSGKALWSVTTAEPLARYPETLPPLSPRVPYIWKQEPQGGKTSLDWKWGVVTFLSAEDIEQLSTEATELEAQIKANPDDATLPVMHAELFRLYGVHGRTMEILEDLAVSDQPGVNDALAEAYAEVGPYAQFLSPLFKLVGQEVEIVEPDSVKS